MTHSIRDQRDDLTPGWIRQELDAFSRASGHSGLAEGGAVRREWPIRLIRRSTADRCPGSRPIRPVLTVVLHQRN
jgi:hypothetical protein